MRYHEGIDYALKNLQFKVEPGMKVGIVGRTGAGKSSILQTLFRLIEVNKGRILIDDIDVFKLGLHYLRKKIAFIPQTPFLM